MSIHGPAGPRPMPLTFPQVRLEETVSPAPVRPDTGRVDAPPIEGPSFQDALGDLVGEVDGAIKTAEQQAADFAEGRSNDIHGTMISMQEADVRLRLLGNVRNRALEAYREIMRMGA